MATAATRALRVRAEAERSRARMERSETEATVVMGAMEQTCRARVISAEPEVPVVMGEARPAVSVETLGTAAAAEMALLEQPARSFLPTEATEPRAVMEAQAVMEVA